MKKAITVILSLSLAILLCSCGFNFGFGAETEDDDAPLTRYDTEETAGYAVSLEESASASTGIISGIIDQIGGGEWPDNEFTQQVPKPAFRIFGASGEDDSFGVIFASVSVDELKAYAEQVRAAGFTIDEEVQDQNTMGVAVYTLSAKNESGYTVSLAYAAGSCSMTIEKE